MDALKEYATPASPRDWSRMLLGIILGVAMLMAGRIWGESLYAETNERAVRNEQAVEALAQRFEDHVAVSDARQQEILEQLREIRGLLQQQGTPQAQ